MNSKFLGNSLDLYKYSLLTHLIANSKGLGLFYVPMLTAPLPKERNPKYMTYELGCHNKPLYKLMKREFAKSYSEIKVIRNYFVSTGIHLSLLSTDSIFDKNGDSHFCEETRKEYFDQAVAHYRNLVNRTLIYVDPDVGCDVGVTRRFRSNKERYVRKHEILKLKDQLRQGDSLAYFQHLGNPNYSINDRFKDLTKVFGPWILFTGYGRIQAGIVFIFNDEETYMDKRKIIEDYFRQYDHLKHRDKFIIQGKPPLISSGFSVEWWHPYLKK